MADASGTVARCARCGATNVPAITGWIGFVGTLRERIREQVCAGCWQQWLDVQLMALNEYRLNLGMPDHRAILANLAEEFLGLSAGRTPASRGVSSAPEGEGASLEHLQQVWTPPVNDEGND